MSYTLNYYAVLGLRAPFQGGDKQLRERDLKAAYKAALFEAHPDKASTKENLAVQSPSLQNSNAPSKYTVDDVKEAYATLAAFSKKDVFDTWLLERYNKGVTKYGRGNGEFEEEFAAGLFPGLLENRASSADEYSEEFLAGLELLDLSDFDVVEPNTGEEEVEWKRACRCGNDMGFRIQEKELESVEKRGVKEVVVGCWGCSLSVRVGFDIEEG